MDLRTAFALLGTPPGASPAVVKDAYRDLVKVWHPDRFAGDARLQAKAGERLRDINEAYRLVIAALPPEAPPRPGSPAPAAPAGPSTRDAAPPPTGIPGFLRRAGVEWFPWRWLGIAMVAILAAPFVLAAVRPDGPDAPALAPRGWTGDGPDRSYLDDLRQAGGGAGPGSGMRAASVDDLGQRLQGRWVAARAADGPDAPGVGIELRDGAVLWPAYPAVVGEYRTLSRSSIRVDDTTSGRVVVYDVWFPTASSMVWRLSVGGVERGRIVFARG